MTPKAGHSSDELPHEGRVARPAADPLREHDASYQIRLTMEELAKLSCRNGPRSGCDWRVGLLRPPARDPMPRADEP
jgi:hypothetical protein